MLRDALPKRREKVWLASGSADWDAVDPRDDYRVVVAQIFAGNCASLVGAFLCFPVRLVTSRDAYYNGMRETCESGARGFSLVLTDLHI